MIFKNTTLGRFPSLFEPVFSFVKWADPPGVKCQFTLEVHINVDSSYPTGSRQRGSRTFRTRRLQVSSMELFKGV